MPKNVKCKNCNNLKNHWCARVVYSPDEDMIRDCQYFGERTNADRIRAMSDEELAKWLDSLRYGFGCELCANVAEKCDENCVEHFVEWLQRPAEVE